MNNQRIKQSSLASLYNITKEKFLSKNSVTNVDWKLVRGPLNFQKIL